MTDPFFTVIIPTYNRAEILREAIQSILNQTFRNFELIVIDDNSTDNTSEIVHEFNDVRIKYIMNDRTKGGAGARNAGIFRSDGKWITFLDDDDTWLPHKFEMQYSQIQVIDESIGFLYAGYTEYDFAKKEDVNTYMPEKEGSIQDELLYTNYITGLPTVAVRKDLLLKVGGFDEQFPALEDWELFVRLAGITRFCFLKENLVHVRRAHKNRISQNFQIKLSAALLFRKKHNNLFRKSSRLCHRIASIILMWSLEMRDWTNVMKAIPWTVAGILVDPYNFFRTIRGVYFKLSKSKRLQL